MGDGEGETLEAPDFPISVVVFQDGDTYSRSFRVVGISGSVSA